MGYNFAGSLFLFPKNTGELRIVDLHKTCATQHPLITGSHNLIRSPWNIKEWPTHKTQPFVLRSEIRDKPLAPAMLGWTPLKTELFLRFRILEAPRMITKLRPCLMEAMTRLVALLHQLLKMVSIGCGEPQHQNDAWKQTKIAQRKHEMSRWLIVSSSWSQGGSILDEGALPCQAIYSSTSVVHVQPHKEMAFVGCPWLL